MRKFLGTGLKENLGLNKAEFCIFELVLFFLYKKKVLIYYMENKGNPGLDNNFMIKNCEENRSL